MGIDLRLLPVHSSWIYSHVVLEFGRVGTRAYDILSGLETEPVGTSRDVAVMVARVPPDGELGYGRLPPKDAYGDEYRHASAGDLARIMKRVLDVCDFPYRSSVTGKIEKSQALATLAYLENLPPETRVILDWH